MSSKRYLVAVTACAAQAVLGTACTDVGVVPEVPEEGGTVALDGPQASWAGQLFPDPENDPRCEHVGSEGGVEEYRCETRTTLLTRNDDDIWFICRYRVQIYNVGGQIVITLDLLRCWIFDPGEGGPGKEEVTLTLECNSPERGSVGSCAAGVEGGDVDLEDIEYEWRSNDTTWSGTGATEYSSWQGTATGDTDITVTVITGEEVKDTMSETVTVSVNARTWPFQYVSAPWVFSSQITSMALYDLPATPSTVPSASEGSGPWEGQFYMASPPQADPLIKIHSDYSAAGPQYLGARNTCTAAANLASAAANLYEVNDSLACNRLSAMLAFIGTLRVHEWDHEDGVNACLSSPAARTALDKIEMLVGDSSTDVTARAQREWSDFYNNSLNLSGFWARGVARNSRSYFWYYSGGWHLGSPGIVDESTRPYSC